MKQLFYLLTLVSGLCQSCSKDIVATTGNITGMVSDARSNTMLSGASVTVSPVGKSMVTGADGRYTFTELPPQEYAVQVAKNGYQTDKKTVTVVIGEEAVLDFLLTPSTSALSLSQSTLDFGNDATTLTLDISNTGASPLSWQISEDVPWFSCTPTSGTVEAGEKSSVIVNVDRNGLERGNYSQTMAISSNGGSAVVRVDMSVAGMNVGFSPKILDFGSLTSSLQLTLTNTGTGDITYTLSPSNEWIKPSKTSGRFSQTEIIQVSADRTSHSEGDYNGTLVLAVGDDKTSIPVKMNIPSKSQPTVSLQTVENVTYNSATFKGAIVTVGSSKITRHGFCWGTEANPEVDDVASSCDMGDCTQAKDYTYNASSLTPSTLYYIRAYAENAEGISYSNQTTFKTLGTPQIPEIETGSVSNIQPRQAVVDGNLLNIGNVEEITQYGHVWSTTPQPDLDDPATRLGRTEATGAYHSTLTGLSPNTTYHVRAYATNRIGTAYGEEVTFTTTLGTVDITTSEVKDITYRSAYCSGQIQSEGGNTLLEKGICWNTSPLPTIEGNHQAVPGSGNPFGLTVSGLEELTTYYVRAYAKTEDGNVYYGNETHFTTTARNILIDKDGYGKDEDWTH